MYLSLSSNLQKTIPVFHSIHARSVLDKFLSINLSSMHMFQRRHKIELNNGEPFTMCQQVVAKKWGSALSKLNISVITKQENILNIFWRAVLSMYTIEMASAPGTSQSLLLSAHSPKIVPGCHLSWKRSQGYIQLKLKGSARCNIINQGLNCLQRFDTVFTFARYIFLSLFYCFLLSTSTTLKSIDTITFLATTNKVKLFLTMFWVA